MAQKPWYIIGKGMKNKREKKRKRRREVEERQQ